MGRLELEDGLKARQKITQAQQKKIKKLYLDAAKRLEKEIASMDKGTKSESLQKSELEKLVKKLKEEAESIGLASEEIMKQGMKDTVDATLEDAKALLADLGLSIQGAYSNVATEIIESIVTGKIYKGNWSLSAAIWDDIKKTQSDILKVVAEGRAMNKSSYEIAKDLERYVNPNAKKDWDWSKVYPGTKKKVDYNAQRLARTLSNHAYQQGVIASAKDNPFVKGIKWNTSNNHDRVCEVCEERAKQDKYGLGRGVYPEDKVPMDHPNGMCVLTRVMPSSAERAERLADWANGKSDPEMDKWINGLVPEKEQKAKKPAKEKSGLTPAQQKKAKEWDEAYERVVGFAKSQGKDVQSTVNAILGKPPKGSKHYSGAADTVAKAFRSPTTRKSSVASQPSKPKRPEFSKNPIVDRTRSKANKYVSEMIKKYGYSNELSEALTDYMMFSDDMNGYLRGLVPYDDYAGQIRTISREMKKGFEEAVYRGCDSKTLGISSNLSEQEIQNRIIGKTYRDKGFLSTSLSQDVAKEFSNRGIDGDFSELPTIITMRVSKDIGKLYVDSGLGEVLLDKGSEIHFIDATIKNGVLHISAEVY